MAIMKTNDGMRIDIEGPSKHLLFSGINDSDLVMTFVQDRREIIQENKLWAFKQGLIQYVHN